MGPILFNIYINNIALAAGASYIHLYADDTIIYRSSASLTTALDSLQASFNKIQQILSSFHVVLNINKTKCLTFKRNLALADCPPKTLSLDGCVIDFVPCYKYLRIWLVNKLSFITHISVLLSKVKSHVDFLCNKSSFSLSVKHRLVKITLLPTLDYGVVFRRCVSTLFFTN